jgi:acetate kinase
LQEHRTHPPLADLYALPREYYEAGVRHYGFHGLSCEYVVSILPRIAPTDEELMIARHTCALLARA